MRRIYLFMALIVAAVTMKAQPQGYYNSAAGLTGDDLKAALHDIIKNDNHVSYNGLWSAYEQTDKKPNGKVWDIYSDIPGGTPPYQYNFGTNQCGEYDSEGDCYNREHLWAQSWTNEDSKHATDLHHVYPTDGFVNQKRSNYAFGEVRNATWTSLNGSKLGNSKTPGYNGTVFEPIDDYKGDIARALMYVSVRYYQEDDDWDNSVMTTQSVINDWAMTMLLRWHRADPVDDKEIARNNKVYSIQGNRNPFVDYPEFAEMIWDPNWTGITYQITVSANPVEGGEVFIGDGAKASRAQELSMDFSAQGYSNGQDLNGVVINLDENVSVVFKKGNGSSTPAYYNTGAAVRCYGGNNFEVSTTKGSISYIKLTFGNGDGSNVISTSVPTFNGTTWTGDNESVTFAIGGSSGHRRIRSMEVNYSYETSTQQATFDDGATAVLTAVPNEGYFFVNWTKDDAVVSTAATYSFTVTEDADFVANFDLIEDEYVVFADPVVKEICIANWDTNGSGELGYDEAAAVTSLGSVFRNNSTITSFDELQYFTGLAEIGNYAFRNCTALSSLAMPYSLASIGKQAFSGCGSLASLTVNAVTPPTAYTNSFNGVDKTIPVNVSCGAANAYRMALGWSDFTNYQQMDCPEIAQITNLVEGWNWFSTFIAIDDPAEGLVMIEEALGDNGVQIKSIDDFTGFDGEDWFGDLEEATNDKMYMIQVTEDCTMTIQGLPVNTEEVEITLEPGWNWIGFPSSEVIAVEDAFAGFEPAANDQIKSLEDYTNFDGEEWFGDLEELTPGVGFMYFNNSGETKVLVFQRGK